MHTTNKQTTTTTTNNPRSSQSIGARILALVAEMSGGTS